jgi:DNA-binding NarL/FixJ family response regulator
MSNVRGVKVSGFTPQTITMETAYGPGGQSEGKGIQMKQRQSEEGSQILTPRERAILELIAEGYKNEEIGERLYISEKTIRGNQMRIMRKLNARSITSALDYALGKELISLYEILESRFSKRKFETNW